MGVPALFRWLSKKYPKIITRVEEELPREIPNADGSTSTYPVDTTKPNPNGEEFDNLYLDMNGIVHPCSHPEDRPPPANEEEMMVAIFEYTERVVNMVRPRKLLLIAVDGVAPRAKMNQQRSRRFRSAQEAAEKDALAAEYHAQMVARGERNDDAKGEDSSPKKTWDSNSITPGTPFMDLLAKSLRYWISYKLTTDIAWANLKIIISDATVPGEGEHKIMNFVRSQRSSVDYDPNTSHVIYGLDADLIMLGIATHEPHFRVLREDVFANDTKPGHCRKCNQPGHIASQCLGQTKPKEEDTQVEKPLKPFIWLHVGILREYLAVEMSVRDQGFQFDLERALDDWVFMCFFVGNDFLPHLPSLDIREDGIDTLIAIWRDNIPIMGGYLTKDGHVDLARAQMILAGLARQENVIFRRRREADLKQQRRDEQNKRHSNKRPRLSGRDSMGNGAPTGYDETVIRRGPKGGIIRGEAAPDPTALPMFAPGAAQTRNDPRYAGGLTHADIVGGGSLAKSTDVNQSAAAAIKAKLEAKSRPADQQKADLDALFASANGGNNDSSSVLGKRSRDLADKAADEATTDPSTPGRNTPNKEIANPMDRGRSGALGGNSRNESESMPEDTVKLWEDGYEGRYYEQKFHVSPDDVEFRHQVARDYVEGLAWVLLYYFQGCPSWTWYYPHHYAPFAADFVGLDKQVVKFEKGKPFRPFEQLMGVMPAASNHTLPSVFHPLMTEDDSPIIEFYPTDFEVDLNGKKFSWQGVALLPFIDEKRLLEAMGTKYPLLTADEHKRNAFGADALLFSNKHPLYDNMVANFYGKKAGTPKFKIRATASQGLSGKASVDEAFVPNSELAFPLDSTQEKYTSLDANESLMVSYHMPPAGETHKSMLLAGIKFDPPVLEYHDIEMTRNRAEKSGRSHGGVQLSENGQRSDGQRIHYGGSYGKSRRGIGSFPGMADSATDLSNLPPGLAAQAAQHGILPQQGRAPTGLSGFVPAGQQAPAYASGYGAPPSNNGYGYNGGDYRNHNGGGYNAGNYNGGHGGGYNRGGYSDGGYNRSYNGGGYDRHNGDRSGNDNGGHRGGYGNGGYRGGYQGRGRGGGGRY